MSDLDRAIAQLRACRPIPEAQVRELCHKARELLIEEGNVVTVTAPVTICGDIHGQFHDLMELFRVGGDVPDTNYLFMGDFVDRGFYSLESFLLLLCLKVRYPDRMTLIRGNHESRQITTVYGFYDECLRKYGSANVWRYCCEVFDYLALGAIVLGASTSLGESKGLRPENLSSTQQDDEGIEIELLNHTGGVIDRFPRGQARNGARSSPSTKSSSSPAAKTGPPDPAPGPQARSTARRSNVRSPLVRPRRDRRLGPLPARAGFLFGADIVKVFNHANDLSMIARAHQLVMEGFKEMFDNSIVTVWSAPNYCYRCGNIAAILELSEDSSGESMLARSNGDVNRSDGGVMKGNDKVLLAGPARRYRVFQAAPQDSRGMPAKKPVADYFL
ncbi:Serine/threonine-protein phosphatase 4 catalytic subunit B [Lachnellula occidentalis]|uniref:Serine/threonine-protein phosphatase n=1 Tax=Lachnellula occidentalis TaxID=215460 RepID=A0A8H8S105_9HELO|nr:Serine/threonine-protein phosphatase 4 catalytic subunit B [Lachnellula occidentalis]